MKIKVLSLFDGISVAQQALKELGYDVEYYASEIDKYAVSQRGRYLVDGKRKDVLGAKTEQRIEVGQSDKAHTITSVTKDSMVMNDAIIRKLTPIECERLQSLPNNYTDGISNSQRYKCLGNAFNKEVIKHILSFMK